MKQMQMTEHARARTQQRGISPFTIDVLLEFGDVEHHRGDQVIYFSRKSERKAKSYFGSLSEEVKKQVKEIYLVKNGEQLITVARRTEHRKRARRVRNSK